jgi:hypothetical protein
MHACRPGRNDAAIYFEDQPEARVLDRRCGLDGAGVLTATFTMSQERRMRRLLLLVVTSSACSSPLVGTWPLDSFVTVETASGPATKMIHHGDTNRSVSC